MGEEDGAGEHVGHAALGGLGDVVAKDVRLAVVGADVVLAQPVDGVGVAHAFERPRGRGEVRVQLVQHVGDARVGEDEGDDAADEVLDVREEVVEGDEVQLGLDMRVLGQMATGQGFLGAEGLFDAVDVAGEGKRGFEVELRRTCVR